jgi:putative addiction module component (TIGR02574 family)
MIVEKIPELKTLTAEEKLTLVGELWDELSNSPDQLLPRHDHIQILEKRLAEYKANPQGVSTWEEVRQRILASR